MTEPLLEVADLSVGFRTREGQVQAIRNLNFTGAATAISWYPNPTHDRLTISSNSNLQSITLTTLDGRILQTVEGFASGRSLDLSRYGFGIYFLVIRTTDGQSHVAKIERN